MFTKMKVMRIPGVAFILAALLIASVPAMPGIADGLTLTRTLPVGNLSPGDTFTVSIQFTVTEGNFNSIGITDTAPAGWVVSVNTTSCSVLEILRRPI
jgi:hypothetical protein